MNIGSYVCRAVSCTLLISAVVCPYMLFPQGICLAFVCGPREREDREEPYEDRTQQKETTLNENKDSHSFSHTHTLREKVGKLKQNI